MIFEKKLDSLFSTPAENQFVEKALKATSETVSNEGALKYDTTDNPFIDQFASIALYKEPRSYQEVSRDMELLWSIDPKLCLKLSTYIRIITRKPKIVTDKVEVLNTQKGQGLRHEFIMRMIWLAVNHRDVFKSNIPYFIAAGAWKDIFEMLSYDLQFNGWSGRKLPWEFIYSVIQSGLVNPETTHLVRKYLPTIRVNKKCTTLASQADTLIGRWIASKMFGTEDKGRAYKNYRIVKSSGKAHSWQQLISKQLYEQISFDSIAGRALALLVGGKFLENHNLTEKYGKWISEKPAVKFTGFVFELFKPLGEDIRAYHIVDYKEATINAQFAKLVEEGKGMSNLLVVRDTSASMASKAYGCNMTSHSIAKALALYFSESLTGPFAGCWAEFNHSCKLHKWEGATVCDKWVNDHSEAYGGTDFQSVIQLFIKMKEEGVEEKDFPTGILCISDGEFSRGYSDDESNFNQALDSLRHAGFSDEYVNNFKIILWDIPNSFYGKPQIVFEDFANAPNFFYMSGYDASCISFLLEGGEFKHTPRNATELFNVTMDQELLNRLTVVPPYQRRGFEKKNHNKFVRR